MVAIKLSPELSPDIRPRKMDFPFDTDIKKHWMGSALGTAIANGLHMLFPLGERFFVRSVRAFADQIDDPELQRQVRAFSSQEGHHAREHERFFKIMEQHGYDVNRFLTLYERIAYDVLEPRTSKKLRLSATAALEHFTASFAEGAFKRDELQKVHPLMRDLLMWHAAEEIEHKSVAFDVLKRVDPSYGLRISGLVVGALTLTGFWFMATVMLVKQDTDVSRTEILRQLYGAVSSGRIGNGEMLRAGLQYLRRDFHPSQIDNLGLARQYLESIGRAEG